LKKPDCRILQKLIAYGRAVGVLRKPHVRGCPAIPKALIPSAPHNREHYNEFIVWINNLCPGEARLIIDVGANHGDFAEAAGTLFPQAEIWLFEPLPFLCEELRKKSGRFSKPWVVHQCALGEKETITDLWVDPMRDDIGSLVGFGGSHQENARSTSRPEKILCEVRPLDNFAAKSSQGKIDLLKIDVEGFEFEVLQGGQHVLAQTQAVLVEVSLMRDDMLTPDRLGRMLELLARAGLMAVEVIPSWFSAKNPWLPVEFNILAKRVG
jgi:FkbM family methyltransferase